MSNKVEILHFERYGESGWRWTRRVLYPDGEAVVSEHRTNGRGEGLWWVDSFGEHHQVRGTGQYSLAADEATARRQVAGR